MEKTTVDFVLLASSIHHCSFCIFLWWCQMLTPSDLRQSALRLSEMCCLWSSPSIVNLVTLHSAVRLKPNNAGQNSCSGWAHCFPSGCCVLEGSGLPEQDGCCSMGDDSAPGSQRLLSQFSPPSLHPQSLLKHLQPTLPPLCQGSTSVADSFSYLSSHSALSSQA